jgi:tetratricopeptide (TPR) repeat protein
MPRWIAFPNLGDYRFDAAKVAGEWPRLHAGDAEPLPRDERVLHAWTLLHNGEFQQAAEIGLGAGDAGLTVANKATCMYANYLEKNERTRLDLFMDVAQRAQAQGLRDPTNANALYWQAYALGRYSKLQPRHADAHIALGTFHAEVIDKVGPLVAGMTYGANRELGLKLFQDGLTLNPTSAIGMIEYANGLLMLAGEDRMPEATRLYEQAASCEPADAVERLHVELARTELVE